LIEVDTADGWLERTILVANTGTNPAHLNVTWTNANELILNFVAVLTLLLLF